MRRASFYIGAIVLGTVGPLALAAWASEVASIHRTEREMRSILLGGAAAGTACSATLAGLGLLVAAVESRAMAASILGGRSPAPGRRRAALARSRMVFWRVVVGVVHRRDPGRHRPGRSSASPSRQPSARRPISRS